MIPRPTQTAAVHSQRRQPRRRFGLTVAAQRGATVVAGALAVTSGWSHRQQLGAGFHLLDHLSWWRLGLGRPAVGPPGHPRGQKALITSAGITREIGSSIREYQFRQRILPDMEFKVAPLVVPTPGTPNQTPTRVFNE